METVDREGLGGVLEIGSGEINGSACECRGTQVFQHAEEADGLHGRYGLPGRRGRGSCALKVHGLPRVDGRTEDRTQGDQVIYLVVVHRIEEIGDLLGGCRSGGGEGDLLGRQEYPACAEVGKGGGGKIDTLGDVGVQGRFEVLDVEQKVQNIRLCVPIRLGLLSKRSRARSYQFRASNSGSCHTEGGDEVPAIQDAFGCGFLELLDRWRGIEDFYFFAGHCVGLLVNWLAKCGNRLRHG